MKTTRLAAGILSSMIFLTMMSGCLKTDNEKDEKESAVQEQSVRTEQSAQTEQSADNENSEVSGQSETPAVKSHTLYVRDGSKNNSITAVFVNTYSGKTEETEMKRTEEAEDHYTFSCEGDASAYNMVYLKYGEEKSLNLSFNEYVSGWYISEYGILPYTEGKEPSYEPEYTTKVFQFDGYDKNVYIWTPKDYDANSAEKYSTIYMLDGQNVLSVDIQNYLDQGVWNVAEHAESMMALSDNKTIIVAIDNPESTRCNELVPDIGKMTNGGKIVDMMNNVHYSTQRGTVFADFVCDTVMPYVQENYNVSKDPLDNAIAGGSLAGLESFYISVEHPDKFGFAGALSPSFWAFDDKTWMEYLTLRLKSGSHPFIYMYSGGDPDNGVFTPIMYQGLLQYGYPKDKLIYSRYEDGLHYPWFWRNMYPEFLKAMFTHEIEPLQDADYSGLAKKMAEKVSKPLSETSKPAESSAPEAYYYDDGNRDPENKNNYLYFDNSETKWEKVWVYWWNSKFSPITNKLTGELYPANVDGNKQDLSSSWPGIEMERIGDTDIYRAVMPVGAEKVVFNTGVKDDDVRNGAEAYQSADIIFDPSSNAGQVYKIDASQEPKSGRGVEKTKFKYAGGEWSAYNG